MEADIMRNIRLRTSAAMLAAFLFAWSLNTACEITRGVYTDVVCVFLGFAWAVCAVWALTSERKTDRTSENLLLSASFLAGLIFVGLNLAQTQGYGLIALDRVFAENGI